MFVKKSLGQNFLIDKNIIKKIVNLVDLKDKNIIEIGPGTGSLTEEILIKKPKSLYLIEKDKHLFDKLNKKYDGNKIIKIFNFDILRFDLEKIIKKNTVILGNLPYNISSQILVKILKLKLWPPNFHSLVFMFQKELADKISGKYASKNYGRLSILTNYRLKIKDKFLVSPNCFFPKPKVISQVIHFQPKKMIPIKLKSVGNLEKITNTLFSNKRKMINKNIKKLLNYNDLSKINIDLSARPSEIKPEIFYEITKIYELK